MAFQNCASPDSGIRQLATVEQIQSFDYGYEEIVSLTKINPSCGENVYPFELYPASTALGSLNLQSSTQSDYVSAEANQLTVTSGTFKKIGIKNLNTLMYFQPTVATAVCLGLQNEMPSGSVFKGKGSHLTLINRSNKILKLPTLSSNVYTSAQFVNFDGGNILNSNFTRFYFYGGKINLMSGASGEYTFYKSSGIDLVENCDYCTIDMWQGTIDTISDGSGNILIRSPGAIKQISNFQGNIELWGGSIISIYGGSGTIILHDGAKILDQTNMGPGWDIISD